MRPRRRSGSTGGGTIQDEKNDVEGYVVDARGKVRGEARNYDPYSRFGEIMLYEIDIFGYVSGYVSKNWHVMSEEDLLADNRLARRLYEAKYQVWISKNINHLKCEYLKKYRTYNKRDFERLCRDLFRRV